jgi:hypothetical protein
MTVQGKTEPAPSSSMMRMVLLLAAALALGSVTAAAGQQAAPLDPSQPLALVIRYVDGRVVRSNIGSTYSSWTPMFPRIDGFAERDGALAVMAVKYAGRRDETGLRMVVSVLRGPQHQQELEIARVTLTGSTPVPIPGLAAVGVRPVELWIEHGDLKRVYSPGVENRTAGLDVTSIEMLDGPPSIMLVAVRNVSAKPAVSYSVDLLGPGRRLLLAAWQALPSGQPVIEPGGSHTFRMNVANVPQPELLAITSVQWTDGTYEGDPRPAALQWCRDAAGRVQIARIMTMLRASAAADWTTALAGLETRALTLEITAERAMMADVASRLPIPAPMTDAEIATTIAFQLQRLKKEFAAEISSARARPHTAAATREWFDAAIAAYGDRLSDLSAR